jgi:hypothetical protein
MDLTSPFMSRLIRLSSYVLPGGQAGHFIRNHIGNPILVTNEKIKRDLGITFMDPIESIWDTVEDFVKWGHVAPSTPPGPVHS